MSLRIFEYDFCRICLTADSDSGNRCFRIDGNGYIPVTGIIVGVVYPDTFCLYIDCFSYQQFFSSIHIFQINQSVDAGTGSLFGDLLQPHILYLIIIFSSLTFEDEASGVVSPVGDILSFLFSSRESEYFMFQQAVVYPFLGLVAGKGGKEHAPWRWNEHKFHSGCPFAQR